MKKNIKLIIIGAGGFAREVYNLALAINDSSPDTFKTINFAEFDDYHKHDYVDSVKVLKISECDVKKYHFVIGIADPFKKKQILNELKSESKFINLISPSSFVSEDIKFGIGVIVMPFCYISCNVKIGNHAHINSHCIIGHDTRIGNFFTSACSVSIAGNNYISDLCYFGMNSCTKQGLSICKNTVVGLNSGVVKDIIVSGTYIGTPAKLFKK
jgi:sugar O-acyltransferase (sialic acid O-acetyltransferase NeuD family)